MAEITNRAEARELLKATLAKIDMGGVYGWTLAEAVEDALADLLLAQRTDAAQTARGDAEKRHEATLDVVFKLVQSARINMESVRSYRHLEKHDPQALSGNDWGVDKYVRDAIKDLTDAGDADDRIPF